MLPHKGAEEKLEEEPKGKGSCRKLKKRKRTDVYIASTKLQKKK
jgi:hypothetical protein